MTLPLAWVARTQGIWRARCHVAGTEGSLTGPELFEALATERGARTALTRALAEVPFAAAAWELPPLSAARAPRIAEFVVVDAPQLARVRADPSPFEGPFADAEGPIATFDNLGGDATLVSPAPDGQGYPHLLAFVRTAPPETIDALWAAVGRAVCASHRDPLWVSTAGLGVHWLHVRLDDRPKYYRHEAYRRI